MLEKQTVTLSYSSIIKVVVVLLTLFILYVIREVVALLFVAIVLSAALDPWVDWLQKYKIPRSVSILIIYIIMIGTLSLVIAMMVPPISEQIGQLAKNLPIYYERLALGVSQITDGGELRPSLPEALQGLSASLGEATKSIFSTITGIFGGLISFIAVLVIVFYMTVEEKILKKFIHFLTPPKYQDYMAGLINRMQKKMGLWLRGQLALCLIIGIMTYIGLIILGVKYALLLALVAGILEIIPFVGPIISAVPAILVGFSDSFVKVLLIIALYIVIQQFENHIIVPKVMQKAVGLNPIIVILAILIGIKLGGIVGALLAVPVAAAVGVFLSDIFPHPSEVSKSEASKPEVK